MKFVLQIIQFMIIFSFLYFRLYNLKYKICILNYVIQNNKD